MCGRFVREVPISEVAKAYGVVPPPFEMSPGYNIVPTNNVAIIVDDGNRRLIRCTWGFISSWAREASTGYRLVNVRAETVAEKPVFEKAFKEQRCLVVASGFYEWRKEGAVKVPVYAHLKTRALFSFAGLYNYWTSPEGESMCTCAIITVEANDLLREVHDRMPAVLHKRNEAMWIRQDADAGELQGLLKSYPSEEMEFYKVSDAVNSPRTDRPENILPA